MAAARERNIFTTFIISTSLVIALVLSGVFLEMALRTRQLMAEENLIRARALFNAIVQMRKWNAEQGGVYVEKKKGMESSPYLPNTDIRTTDGRVFLLKNPALMTREISEYAAKAGLFTFHITSLKLLNPNNKPDAFEEKALRRFEAGDVREASETEMIGKRSHFRYMAPLTVEKACLQCHKHQNYAVGEVRGGISVSFDIEDLQSKVRFNIITIIVFGIAITLVLLAVIYLFMSILIKRLEKARQTIEMLAITDQLTDLYNRRHIMARIGEEFEKFKRLKKSVSCIMADIDDFKAINDTLGHLAGDQVLKEISLRLRNTVRAYDILGRYGGEEFLIIMPDTDLDDARGLAERIRSRVREETINKVTVTLSLGVVCVDERDLSVDNIIRRADENLYRAKAAGKDRVVS